MNDLLSHERYVEEHPNDKAAALALIDRHVEELRVSYRTSLRAVAAMRRAAREAIELKQAAALIAPDSEHAWPITRAVRGWVANRLADYGTVFLVPGRKRPRLSAPTVNTFPPSFGSVCIIVGARFVLALHRVRMQCLHLNLHNRPLALAALLG